MGEPDERPHRDGGVDDFDAIVAGWHSEGEVPQWPTAPAPAAPAVPAPAPAPAPAAEDEDEHFVPPDPPPLPRLGPPAAVGLVLLVLGVVLVSAPGWVGVPGTYGLPLGLLTLAAGLGWLELRLWPTPPGPGDDDDDGAFV